MGTVVITGLGIVSPVGNDVDTFWHNVCQGKSGIKNLDRFDTQDFTFKRGGQVQNFSLPDQLPRWAQKEDLAIQFLLAAAHQAIARARLPESGLAAEDVAVVVATNFGGSDSGEAIFAHTLGKGDEGKSDWRKYQYQRGADAVADVWGYAGPRQTLSLSCSSGTAALAVAADLVRTNQAKIVISGGYDAISRFAWLGLSALRTITRDEVRPFDAQRDGTIFSEGAGVIVVESRASAAARGAEIICELAGAATNNNAFHITAPAKHGAGSTAVIAAALADARVDVQDIDHINTHGTGTSANDSTETRAIKNAFGGRAYQIPITSIKSSIGHMLGAAGSAEAIAAILSIRDGIIPPTINYQHPDPDCDLDLVANSARNADLKTVLSNSAGIGGCNAAAIFTQYRDPTRVSKRTRGEPEHRRVAITGLGPASAIGIGKDEFFEGLAMADDGVAELTLFADPELQGTLVAEMPDFVLKDYFTKPKGYLDRATQLAFAAAVMALKDAELSAEQIGGGRHGIALGTAAGCSETAGRFFADFLAKGPRFVKPILFPHTYFNTTISMLAIEYGLAGPHLSYASGLVSGAQAIAAAADQIRFGRADLMLAGGVDALSPEWLYGLKLGGALVGGDAPLPICAPLDEAHCGMAPGEGAAILVLEDYEHAVSRGATIYGELPMTAGAGDGTALERALYRSMTGLTEPPDLIVSGANGRAESDTAEAVGIRAALDKISGCKVTAPKSLFGETGGAAPGLQIAAGIFASRGVLPSTLNLQAPQPEAVGLDVVANTGVHHQVRAFIVTATDPGGTAEAIAVRATA